jgi:Flp pilus assembly pilin Flp
MRIPDDSRRGDAGATTVEYSVMVGILAIALIILLVAVIQSA